jgi:nucleotide-binding universal stress UspA family protein
VLAIDRKVRFRPVERIIFATDFVETRARVLKPLKDLAQLFDAKIYILNIVIEPIVAPAMEEMIAAYKLDRALKNIHHTFFYLHRSDVVEGINDFVSTYKMDMAVMISRRHSFFGRLLAEPHTKHMAFHSKVPLLALQATND